MSCSVKSVLTQGLRRVVSVNGTVIRHDAISREAQNHPAPTPIAAWTAAARALIVRELLLQEARRAHLAAEPLEDDEGRRETDEEAMMRALIEREVKTPTPDEASCRRYYQQNRRRFRSADIYAASHILISARRDRATAFAAARERAERLLVILASEPARFAELARANSDCPSAACDGNLGQLTAGAVTPEFEKAMAGLAPGETSAAPVETLYGFHIIRLDRRIPGCELPFEAVHQRIAEYLAERTHRLAVAQYVARLVSCAELKGVELPTAADLRVH